MKKIDRMPTRRFIEPEPEPPWIIPEYTIEMMEGLYAKMGISMRQAVDQGIGSREAIEMMDEKDLPDYLDKEALMVLDVMIRHTDYILSPEELEAERQEWLRGLNGGAS